MYSGIIEHILGNHRIYTMGRLRLSLPISLSGLGLPIAQNVAPAAYSEELYQCRGPVNSIPFENVRLNAGPPPQRAHTLQ
jgi:hypothetical protein